MRTRIIPTDSDRQSRLTADPDHSGPTQIEPGFTSKVLLFILRPLGIISWRPCPRVRPRRRATQRARSEIFTELSLAGSLERGGERRSKTPKHTKWVGQGCSTRSSAAGLNSNPYVRHEATGVAVPAIRQKFSNSIPKAFLSDRKSVV